MFSLARPVPLVRQFLEDHHVDPPVLMLRRYLESHRDLFGSGSVLGYIHMNAAHVHVWAGLIALVSAIVAFLTAKGQPSTSCQVELQWVALPLLS